MNYDDPLNRTELVGDLGDAKQSVGEAADVLRYLRRDAAGSLVAYRPALDLLIERATELSKNLQVLEQQVGGPRRSR